MDRAALQERFGIIGTSAAIRHVIDQVRLVARTEVSVLIQGESGVGKELIADAIHTLSLRKHAPLITVNCGAIPEGLIESELFGNEKGAYTGAVERRSGYFEDANKGTIFLDEIGEMPLPAQVRLLRVLESGEFSRVGASTVRHTDARIIAATNKDLAREVEAGRFREDLYYRLSTVIIPIPPLRERKEDILPIFSSFLHRYAQQYDTGMKQLDDEARALLLRYRWPGNVRELRNVAERVVVLHRSARIQAEDLRPHLRGVTASGTAGGLIPLGHDAPQEEEGSRERELIYRALLELRMEIREMKEQLRTLIAGSPGPATIPRGMLEPPRRDVVVYQEPEPDQPYPSFIEEVPYEIEEGPVTFNDAPDPVVPATSNDALPTLADAEKQLITIALERYDGNRRQTARALGISERTLYRKIKEFEDTD